MSFVNIPLEDKQAALQDQRAIRSKTLVSRYKW